MFSHIKLTLYIKALYVETVLKFWSFNTVYCLNFNSKVKWACDSKLSYDESFSVNTLKTLDAVHLCNVYKAAVLWMLKFGAIFSLTLIINFM